MAGYNIVPTTDHTHDHDPAALTETIRAQIRTWRQEARAALAAGDFERAATLKARAEGLYALVFRVEPYV